ncbi:MAG TPA: hypothetical protein VM529_08690, partial [Gemmata sp.]|nr:hypothetical protein [Gemmata sp.]
MAPTPTERAVRSARRRLAAQLFLDRVADAWVVALAVGLAWLLIDPDQWAVAAGLVAAATLVAAARTARDYPGRVAAALELDGRFRLKERVTAAIDLPPGQRETAVGLAVVADAEKHAAGLRVADEFPVKPGRRAAVAAAMAALAVVVASVWHPVTDSGLFAPDGPSADAAKKPDEAAPKADPPAPRTDPNRPEPPAAQRLAELRAVPGGTGPFAGRAGRPW